MNAVEIEQAISELAQKPFDVVEFPFAFLAAFGHKETTLKRLRTGNNNVSDVAGAAHLLVTAHKQMSATEAQINRLCDERLQVREIPLTNFCGIELRLDSTVKDSLTVAVTESATKATRKKT